MVSCEIWYRIPEKFSGGDTTGRWIDFFKSDLNLHVLTGDADIKTPFVGIRVTWVTTLESMRTTSPLRHAATILPHLFRRIQFTLRSISDGWARYWVLSKWSIVVCIKHPVPNNKQKIESSRRTDRTSGMKKYTRRKLPFTARVFQSCSFNLCLSFRMINRNQQRRCEHARELTSSVWIAP